MRIGMVRHYRVDQPVPRAWLVSGDDAAAWFAAYDRAPIAPGHADLGGIEWDRCVSSDLPRALRTAELLFPEPRALRIEPSAWLREIPLPPIGGGLRLPFWGWAAWARLSWRLHRAAREEMANADRRVLAVLDELERRPERNVLLVGHGAFMLQMKKELKRRGYRGPRFFHPKNGELYIFDKDMT